MTERAKPRGDIIKKLVKLTSPAILATMAVASIACEANITNIQSPDCKVDPQKKVVVAGISYFSLGLWRDDVAIEKVIFSKFSMISFKYFEHKKRMCFLKKIEVFLLE